LEEDSEDSLVEETNDEQEDLETDLASNDEEIQKLKAKLAENDAIIAELMFRQDSIEAHRKGDLERRFNMVMQMVQRETQGNRPDLEERARKIYFVNNDKSADSSYIETKSQLANQENTKPQKTLVASTLSRSSSKASARKKPTVIKSVVQPKDATSVSSAVTSNSKNKPVERPSEFSKLAAKHNIKSKVFTNLQGVNDGYYVIVNVYKGDRYMNKFIKTLSDKGIEADYFINPKNGLRYVYLKRYDNWKNALSAYRTDINDAYPDQKWIMNVDNTDLYTDKAYVNNTRKIKEKAAKYEVDVLQKNTISQDKTVAQAPTKRYAIRGLDSGYYIIANVFANPKNANRFVKLLNQQGLSASYFINPKNNYRYVYLKKHSSWNNALISYYTKLNNAYTDKTWIMRVTPNQLT